MKADSSILRKLIRMTSWFAPLILWLQPLRLPVADCYCSSCQRDRELSKRAISCLSLFRRSRRLTTTSSDRVQAPLPGRRRRNCSDHSSSDCSASTRRKRARPPMTDAGTPGRSQRRPGWAWSFGRYSERYAPEEREAVARNADVHGHRCIPRWEWRPQQRGQSVAARWAGPLSS
jgi:hypothetical protein